MNPSHLYGSPNALWPDYQRFGVERRLLLTGHSHQAWPDCALDGQIQAFSDAAEFADDKWERAFERVSRVAEGFRRLLDDDSGAYTLAPSTHDLVVRWLSAIDLRRRPRIVSTDGEFHSARRQLDRLAEEGIEVARVAHKPVEDVADRLVRSIDDRTAGVLVSAVFFTNAHIVPALNRVADACPPDRHFRQ